MRTTDTKPHVKVIASSLAYVLVSVYCILNRIYSKNYDNVIKTAQIGKHEQNIAEVDRKRLLFRKSKQTDAQFIPPKSVVF